MQSRLGTVGEGAVSITLTPPVSTRPLVLMAIVLLALVVAWLLLAHVEEDLVAALAEVAVDLEEDAVEEVGAEEAVGAEEVGVVVVADLDKFCLIVIDNDDYLFSFR